MSTPSEPQSPTPGTGPAQSSTQEIPVVTPASGTPTTVQQLPPPSAPVHPPAAPGGPPTTPTATPAGEAQPTGPVDFVPGLPGAGASPPPPAAADAATERSRAPRDRAALIGAGLVVLSLVLLQLALSLRFGTESAWSTIPLWSAFATVCVVLGLAAFARLLPVGRRLDHRTGWRVAAGGLGGLAVFWVLVVLPDAGTDRGFLHTAALGALGGAVWLAAGRADRPTEDAAPARG
ncbi:hypothetical protein [Blastococcus sp. SYSU DS1024]